MRGTFLKLSPDYTTQKFYQYAGYPKYNRSTRTHYGGCPICREGKNWGRKRRLYYIVDNDYLYCHNCGWTGSPVKFIQEVSSLTIEEIKKESKEYDILPIDVLRRDDTISRKPSPTLPHDSINLFDSHQLTYYKDNEYVKKCLDIVAERRLDTAINKPQTLWISLVDYIHKNRLIIPFYNRDNEIQFYQTRTILQDSTNRPKYLSKVNSVKTVFNINNVSTDMSNLFIFEGPIDAFFIKNGVAIAGINENSSNNFTDIQKQQLLPFKFHTKIWLLDSQWLDKPSYKKTSSLIDNGEDVFIWPESYGKRFKDFNDMCIALKIDEIPINFVLDNTFTGMKAKVIMSQIQS
jgi:hypothetical protein